MEDKLSILFLHHFPLVNLLIVRLMMVVVIKMRYYLIWEMPSIILSEEHLTLLSHYY
jgi:hypothetical protein